MYYKVVNTNGGQLRSILEHDFTVEYVVNEWVYPTLENSKLFVFESLERALKFKRDSEYSYEEVFECEVVNPAELPYISMFVSKINAFWNPSILDWCEQGNAPVGTFGVDAVKLIRKVS